MIKSGLLKQILMSCCFIITSVHATSTPEIVVNDPITGQPLPSKTASQNPTVSANPAVGMSSPTKNPNQPTLAELNTPNLQQLLQANEQLLTDNANLQRQIDSLNTQVNVLVNERSGQLFSYGVFTVFISLALGVFLGWVLGRKGRW